MLVAVVLATILALGAPAAAGGTDGEGSPASLALTGATPVDGGLELKATLTDAGGRAMGNREIRFYVVGDLFGQLPVLLKESLTDAAGMATIRYQPTWTGTHELVVEYPGGLGYLSARQSTTFQAERVTAPYGPRAGDLVSVRRWTATAAVVTVILVWLVMLSALFRPVLTLVRTREHAGRAVPAWQQSAD